MKDLKYYLVLFYMAFSCLSAHQVEHKAANGYYDLCDRTRPESSGFDHMQAQFNFSANEYLAQNSRAVRSLEPNEFAPFTMQTLYGPVVVDDPLIAQLIESAPMQRLKAVHQYGITYFIDDIKWFSRYEHSVGVWALLKMYGASREEQVAGLLHDVSHTVFSHVGDWFFKKNYVKESHQDEKHEWYLQNTNIPKILKQYDLTIDDIKHKENGFKLLEQPRPDLCVDRIEYNLRGGLIEGMIEKHDIRAILDDLEFENGKWFFKSVHWAKTFSFIALHHTEHVWGGSVNHMIYQWAADALHRSVEIGLLTINDIYFSTDSVVWQKLVTSTDTKIQTCIKKLKRHKTIVRVVTGDNFDAKMKTKFSGVDPLVKVGDSFKRLTELDLSYKHEYDRVKSNHQMVGPLFFCMN